MGPIEILQGAGILFGRTIERGPVVLVHGHNADAREPVDRQTELAREQAVAASADVTAQAHRVARPGRQGEAVAPVEPSIEVPVGGATLGVIDAALRVEPDLVEQADIDDGERAVVEDKVLITMAPTPDAGPARTDGDRARQRLVGACFGEREEDCAAVGRAPTPVESLGKVDELRAVRVKHQQIASRSSAGCGDQLRLRLAPGQSRRCQESGDACADSMPAGHERASRHRRPPSLEAAGAALPVAG